MTVIKTIQSRDNPFFKVLLKLASSKRNRSKAGQTLLDGTHLLASYLEAGFTPRHLLVTEAALQNAEVAGLLARARDVPVTQLDERLFEQLSDLKSTTGLLSVIDIPVPGLLEVGVRLSDRFVLLLEDIQDPGNLGSMLRSAAAAGCDSVFLSFGCADAWSPKVLRAAMGGHFQLSIHEQQDLQRVATDFPGKILATTLQDAHSLYERDLSGDIAFMIGNEGAGLSDALRALSTHPVKIPMPGGIESLNAAAATAICLFEAVRQRLPLASHQAVT